HLGAEQPGPRSDLQLRHADPQRHGDVSRNGARIIVVDDDISVRRALSRLLISAGYQAQTFESVRDLLMNGELGRTACVIVDVRMPGPGGLELQEILSQVPVPIRSEEHTSELQSRSDLVCRLLLEKKNT